MLDARKSEIEKRVDKLLKQGARWSDEEPKPGSHEAAQCEAVVTEAHDLVNELKRRAEQPAAEA